VGSTSALTGYGHPTFVTAHIVNAASRATSKALHNPADYAVVRGDRDGTSGRMSGRPSEGGVSLLAATVPRFGIDLYWLPIGAGGTGFVRLNGQAYEAITAFLNRRKRCDLYHSGLEVRVPEGRYTIEQTPAAADGKERGVVGIGPIGAHWLAQRVPIFRYELRRWQDGVIPDIDDAVDSPQRISRDPGVARRLLELVSQVPMLVWGRDELHAGEMWNSNSQIAWLLARAGVDATSIAPPPGGRAPGWHAGLAAAARGLTPSKEPNAQIALGAVMDRTDRSQRSR
jgi:hypothetical protein